MHTVGRNMNKWNCYEKLYQKHPDNSKSESPQESVTTLFGVHKELIKSVCLIDVCTLGSLQHYPFTTAKNYNQAKCLSTDELRKCGILCVIEYYNAMNK